MHALADNGGFALVEDGDRLLFFERRILPSWLVFTPGLLAGIAFANAVVQLLLGHPAAGAALLALAAAGGLGVRAVVRSRRRAQGAPLDPGQALVVVDLRARALLDGGGRVLAHLDAVRIERSMQLTSSARSLRVVWPDGAKVVYRGDALQPGGSIAPPIEALRAKGLSVGG